MLGPFIKRLLQSINLTVNRIVVKLRPIRNFIFNRLKVQNRVTYTGVLRLRNITRLVTMTKINSTTATGKTLIRRVNVINFARVNIFRRFTMLMLYTILRSNIPVIKLLTTRCLVKGLSVLNDIVPRTVDTINRNLRRRVIRTFNSNVVLNIRVPRTKRLILNTILSVIMVKSLLILVMMNFILPLTFSRVGVKDRVIKRKVSSSTRTMLIHRLTRFLRFIFQASRVITGKRIN